jgi:transcriptional regulator with XRE-family HTH domain
MNIREKIGQRIRELRIERQLSQEALAFNAGVDRTYMSDLENGRRNVSVEILERVVVALGISFKDFFDHKEFKK